MFDTCELCSIGLKYFVSVTHVCSYSRGFGFGLFFRIKSKDVGDMFIEVVSLILFFSFYRAIPWIFRKSV